MRPPAALLLAIMFFSAAQTGLAQKKLTIIGSSTSFCVGPTVIDSCYVSRLRAYFNKQAPNDTTINNDLAVAGSALYRGMPSTYIPPYADPLLQPDPLHNITAALATHPDVILINYPTNGYDSLPLSNVLFCFRTIRDVANQAGVPCFITTTQPRSSYPFVTSAAKRRLADLKDSILLQFGSFAIDFYSGLFNPADSSIRYDAGDGTHMNNTGHDSLCQRVLRKNVFSATVIPVPACAANTAPVNATTIATQTTATLTWTAPATATLYDVYIWTGATAPVTPTASNTTATSYITSGLTASTLYNWYVVPKNAGGPATGCSSSNKTSFTTAAGATVPGTGLQGDYFNNITLTGTPVVTRVDPAINFDYIYTQSAPGMNLENYSVRWTGQVKPLFSETYTFYAVTDDGVRLWVNGVQLVNNWVNQGATEKSGTITLAAGQKYDIVMEYYQGNGYASSKLLWSSPSTPKAIVPAAQLFPPNSTLPKPPACASNQAPSNGSSIASATSATLAWNNITEASSYNIYIWTGPTAPSQPAAVSASNTFNATGLLPGNNYSWYIVPVNAGGPAADCIYNKTSFTTADAVAGTGLQGDYFNNITLTGAPVVTRIDPTINFDYIYTQSAQGMNLENYSVRWTGKVKPLYNETYTFYTVTDDGVRLWVNGQLLVNNWINQGATEKNGSISLAAGQQYDIVMEYYQGTGYASAQLLWSSASTAKAVIPAAQLYPPAAAARTAVSSGMPAFLPNNPIQMLAPNPVRQGQPVCLRVSSQRIGNATIRIVNSLGQIISMQGLTLQKGMNTRTINTATFSQGIYFIQIAGADVPISIKLMIQ